MPKNRCFEMMSTTGPILVSHDKGSPLQLHKRYVLLHSAIYVLTVRRWHVLFGELYSNLAESFNNWIHDHEVYQYYRWLINLEFK
ncbi:hypothetical protein Taro_033376 [Colocasia esculenta]|uniref:Uncharacterized protein n=1 Tax=Colocasia esculenta TaxID=4460 RepID=A0A843WCB9_COLES|nr:hypothetical protein [Colocasia esculenta]